MNNPWAVLKPYDVMFSDKITITGRRPNSQSLSCDCMACVYPPSQIEQFTSDAEETKILKQKILVMRIGDLSCDFEPQIGDKIVNDYGVMYVSDTNTKQEWYDITARSKKQ